MSSTGKRSYSRSKADFLVAYNANLNTTSVRREFSCRWCEREMEEKSKWKGEEIVPELAKQSKRDYWYIEEYGIAPGEYEPDEHFYHSCTHCAFLMNVKSCIQSGNACNRIGTCRIDSIESYAGYKCLLPEKQPKKYSHFRTGTDQNWVNPWTGWIDTIQTRKKRIIEYIWKILMGKAGREWIWLMDNEAASAPTPEVVPISAYVAALGFLLVPWWQFEFS